MLYNSFNFHSFFQKMGRLFDHYADLILSHYDKIISLFIILHVVSMKNIFLNNNTHYVEYFFDAYMLGYNIFFLTLAAWYLHENSNNVSKFFSRLKYIFFVCSVILPFLSVFYFVFVFYFKIVICVESVAYSLTPIMGFVFLVFCGSDD